MMNQIDPIFKQVKNVEINFTLTLDAVWFHILFA